MIFILDSYYLVISIFITIAWQSLFALFGTIFKSDKGTDLSYGTNFVGLTIIILLLSDTYYIRQIVVTILVCIWGIRLAGYLFYRINKIGHDHRFDEVRGSCVKFSIWFIFQFIAVWLISSPQVILNGEPNNPPIGALDIIGWTIWTIGFLFESISDQQRFNYRMNPSNKAWCETGLWRFSRHPNYFGEICCWWGCFLSCASILAGWRWFCIIGPIFITVLLMFGSGIPTTEKSTDKRFGHLIEYQEYKQRTPVLLPFIPGVCGGSFKNIFCCEWSIYNYPPTTETTVMNV